MALTLTFDAPVARPTFPTTEAAWFWTMSILWQPRPNQPDAERETVDTILRALDRAYRNRKLHLSHARTLRKYGQLGRIPTIPAELRTWREAMDVLTPALALRGVVAPARSAAA